MTTKKLFLYFPPTKIDAPIVYHLVKEHNLTVNIFRAKVTPDENGFLVLDVTGDDENIESGIEYIRSLNVEVNEQSKGLRWEEEKCVHCGNCVPHCPTDALSVIDRQTMRISFNENLCIQCLSCIENCPFSAVKSVF
ncbi:MAG TPA: 4Fe-4S binding protein [Oligoflexia bacterium]|nr:4Fe-4S binding protein [Oligoflexia bacterium]